MEYWWGKASFSLSTKLLMDVIFLHGIFICRQMEMLGKWIKFHYPRDHTISVCTENLKSSHAVYVKTNKLALWFFMSLSSLSFFIYALFILLLAFLQTFFFVMFSPNNRTEKVFPISKSLHTQKSAFERLKLLTTVCSKIWS